MRDAARQDGWRVREPGPWVVRVNDRERVDGIVAPNPAPGDDDNPKDAVIVETDSGHYPPGPGDAMLIAVTRNILPQLLAVAQAVGEVVRVERGPVSKRYLAEQFEAHRALAEAWDRLGSAGTGERGGGGDVSDP